MLTEADLRLLTSIRFPMSISELSNSTEYSSSYVSERVTHLEELGLVMTTRQNREKQVRTVQTPVYEALQALSANHPHIDFPSIISPSMLRVCWFLDQPTAVSEIAPHVTLKRRRIYQLLEDLISRGFITKHEDRYALTDELTGLAEFAQTVIRYEHQQRARLLLAAATVVWSGPNEALITAQGESHDTIGNRFESQENWSLTGIPRFRDFGLELFAAGPPHYFYSELRDEVTVEDVIAHTLLAEADTRNLSYCAVLVAAGDLSRDELREAAWYYRIEGTVETLIRFVETNGESRPDEARYPQWEDVTSLASQYGVTV
jgi:predicted transcriptional regulator